MTAHRIHNLGPVSMKWLRNAGIETLEDLKKAGVLETYKRIAAVEPNASLNLLWGLVGAVNGWHWSEVPSDIKEQLKKELGT
jgi:DNA transformation protein and related proteins